MYILELSNELNGWQMVDQGFSLLDWEAVDKQGYVVMD